MKRYGGGVYVFLLFLIFLRKDSYFFLIKRGKFIILYVGVEV